MDASHVESGQRTSARTYWDSDCGEMCGPDLALWVIAALEDTRAYFEGTERVFCRCNKTMYGEPYIDDV